MKSENTKKNLHAGHRQRVKANVCKNGFSQLEDHRLLELILFYSIPQADTNGLAHKLLEELGSLKNIFNADIDRLCMVDGVGESTAIMLSAMGEAHRRSQKSSADHRKAYKTHDDYRELAVSYLAGESKEVAFAFYFDSADKLKRAVPLSSGDDTTLERMNRRYTTSEFRQIVEILRNHIPEVALTTDIIVGFPGETDEEFETTYNFLKEIKQQSLLVLIKTKQH